MKVFAFVDRQRAEFAVKTLCRVCRVSTSGYYDWIARRDGGPSAAVIAEEELVDQIRLVHAESRDNYGEPRITAQLAREGVVVNHKRVQRLMARHGIKLRPPSVDTARRPLQSPQGANDAPGPHGHALRRPGRARLRPRRTRRALAGRSHVATDEGWVYVSGVSDACSRRLLGWSITDHLRTDGPLDALHAAVDCRSGDVDGVVFHSDKGCQYTAADYSAACGRYGVTQSMGSVGDSYDNAQAEAVWSSLKREAIDHRHFATRAEARRAIFSWIVWYNSTRLHTSIGRRPPVEYEAHLSRPSSVAA